MRSQIEVWNQLLVVKELVLIERGNLFNYPQHYLENEGEVKGQRGRLWRSGKSDFRHRHLGNGFFVKKKIYLWTKHRLMLNFGSIFPFWLIKILNLHFILLSIIYYQNAPMINKISYISLLIMKSEAPELPIKIAHWKVIKKIG